MSDAVQIQVNRQQCAYDPFRYLPFLPVHSVVKQECPFFAVEESRYCMPHTVLHGGLRTKEWACAESNYIEESITLFSQGLLIEPSRPFGQLHVPGWWEARLN